MVFTINRTPVAGGNSFVSAQECLVGRKLDYRKIFAWNLDNTFKLRRQIILRIRKSRPTRPVDTSALLQPMPTEVIEAVNALSNSEDDVPRALTFHYGDHNIADDPESHGGDDQGTDTIVARTSEEAAVPVSPSGDVASIASGDDSTVS